MLNLPPKDLNPSPEELKKIVNCLQKIDILKYRYFEFDNL